MGRRRRTSSSSILSLSSSRRHAVWQHDAGHGPFGQGVGEAAGEHKRAQPIAQQAGEPRLQPRQQRDVPAVQRQRKREVGRVDKGDRDGAGEREAAEERRELDAHARGDREPLHPRPHRERVRQQAGDVGYEGGAAEEREGEAGGEGAHDELDVDTVGAPIQVGFDQQRVPRMSKDFDAFQGGRAGAQVEFGYFDRRHPP